MEKSGLPLPQGSLPLACRRHQAATLTLTGNWSRGGRAPPPRTRPWHGACAHARLPGASQGRDTCGQQVPAAPPRPPPRPAPPRRPAPRRWPRPPRAISRLRDLRNCIPAGVRWGARSRSLALRREIPREQESGRFPPGGSGTLGLAVGARWLQVGLCGVVDGRRGQLLRRR